MARKRMKLPNGFGQITKIKNKRLRNPYRAMVTVGKTEEGKPICKLLKPQAYFKTYNEAYTALLEYNKNPYDISKDMTVKELYERWSTEYFKTLTSESSARTIKSAWSFCGEIYDMKVSDVRVRHIRYCMDNGRKVINGVERHVTPNMKSRIKSLFNIMLDYAVEYEIVDRNYARLFNITDVRNKSEVDTQSHMPFTKDEMDKLWLNVNKIEYVDVVLIQCYTGLRPQELGLIRLENVDLKSGFMIGGMKTESGTNRTIPIHSKIYSMVERKYNEAIDMDSKYLINVIGGYDAPSESQLTYGKYRYRFMKILKELNINPDHKCHDPRMHFITMAKEYRVDEYAIKYIVRHAISDITEKIYTNRNNNWLKEEIEKIK